MKLSEILETYPVTALNQSEFVTIILDGNEDDEFITVQWNDSDEMVSYSQEFFNQEIEVTKEPGHFHVITRQGEKVGFIAYQPVDLSSTQEETS